MSVSRLSVGGRSSGGSARRGGPRPGDVVGCGVSSSSPSGAPPGSPPSSGPVRLLGCALLAVISGLATGGYAGDHSDLAIQRTLVAVRRQPAVFPGDLVADHALAHPSWLFDLWALLPAGSATELLVHVLLLGLIGAGAARAAQSLGARGVGMALAAAVIVLPRALLAEGRLVHVAPLARNLALGLHLWGLAAALRGAGARAGVWAGLALAAHPTTGLPGLLVLGGVATARRGGSRQLGALLGLSVLVGGVVLAPWLLLAEPGPASSLQARLLALRLGHHLDVVSWDPGGWAILVVHLGLALAAARRLRSPPLAVGAGLALGLVGLGVLARPTLLPDLSRLHLAYAAGWLAVVAVLGGALAVERRGWRGGLWLLPLVVLFENTVVDELPGGGWRVAPPVQAAEGTAPPRMDCREDAWVRHREGRPVHFSIKDGGEVVGSAVFAARWARRLEALCGPAATAAPGDGRPVGRGWERIAARCAHVPRCGGAP